MNYIEGKSKLERFHFGLVNCTEERNGLKIDDVSGHFKLRSLYVLLNVGIHRNCIHAYILHEEDQFPITTKKKQ